MAWGSTLGDYSSMAEMSAALKAGMTPVITYWGSGNVGWLDGVGKDGLGPCNHDNTNPCADSVKLYDFSIVDFKSTVETDDGVACPGTFNMAGHGSVSLVPKGWYTPDVSSQVRVDNDQVIPHLASRGYFAYQCTAGVYDHTQH